MAAVQHGNREQVDQADADRQNRRQVDQGGEAQRGDFGRNRGNLDRAADLGIERIWVDAINPRPRVWPAVAELLRAKFPDLLQPYRKILFDLPSRATYLMEVRNRIDDAARRKHLTDRVAACM